MEDIVAVKVMDYEGNAHYFITWGRVFDAVDPESLLQAITPHLPRFGIKNFTDIRLCSSLREASGQLYFYEALFNFSQKTIPFGKSYELWRKKQQERIQNGKEIYYLGKE
jgi:hypothetical protein